MNQFSSLPPLKGDSFDTTVVTGYEKANVLKVFFAKQSVLDGSRINLCDYDIQIDDNFFHSMKISPAEVLGIFRTLHLGKASGPDGINNRIVIENVHQILASHRLSQFYNQSLNT